jgi:hypothetical protein
MPRIVLICCCILAMLAGRAMTISRTLLMPDGKPAAGAVVLARVLTPEGAVQEERRAVADAKGVFTLELTLDPALLPDASAPGGRQPGYLLVDAPGCALTFATLAAPAETGYTGAGPRRMPAPPGTLRLGAGYALQGMVTTPAGTPVAGAAVAVQALDLRDLFGLGMVALNNAATGLATPGFTTVSDKTGVFRLRGVSYVRGGGASTQLALAIGALTTVPAAVAARVASPIGVLAGEARLTYHLAPLEPGAAVDANVVHVLPVATVRGRVLHAITGAPVAGATVRLASAMHCVAGRLPVVTGADGVFRFDEVATETPVCVLASHPDLAACWAQPLAKLGGVRDGEVRLRPWTTLAGTVADAHGTVPCSPVTVTAVYDEGYSDGTLHCGRYSASATAGPDGRFTLRTAAGANTVSLRAAGYRLDTRVQALDVPLTGIADCRLVPARERGFLIHFAPADGLVVQTRLPNGPPGSTTPVPAGGWWFRLPRGAETALEFRVLRHDTEVLPWTPLTLDDKDWGREIKVPE